MASIAPEAKDPQMMKPPQTSARYLSVFVIALCLGSCGKPDATSGSNEPAGQNGGGDPIIAELLADLSGVQEKMVALADEFAQEQYDWRPADDVRSSAEVFMHVAAINFAFPLFAGHEAPASTGLTMENLPTAAPTYENSLVSRDDIRPALSASFGHLRAAIESMSASGVERQITVFGEAVTVRAFWIGHIGHLHEHLGQSIAYGRTNGVIPPWSQ